MMQLFVELSLNWLFACQRVAVRSAATDVAVKTDDPLQDAKAAQHNMGSATGLALAFMSQSGSAA